MSFFLCVAMPREATHLLPSVFDKSIFQTDASDFPIGKAAIGKNRSWSAVLLQIGSSSAFLVGIANIKKTHNNDRTELLLSGINALMEREECPSLTLLGHWMRGYISTEDVPIEAEKRIDLSVLSGVVSDFEVNIRYTVFSQSAIDQAGFQFGKK